MKRTVLACCLLPLLAYATQAQQNLEISLKNNTQKEAQTKQKLLDMVNKYKLSKWIFTRKVQIDEQERIPHSHPVLTLNTQHLDDDLRFIAVFVHEQIHWHEEAHSERRDQAIKELESIYPDIPTTSPQAARNRNSTYLHLLVCYLEYEAMKELAGVEKAREILQSWTYYTWVYKTVLSDTAKMKAVVEKHKLTI